jgi:hypothetical protein
MTAPSLAEEREVAEYGTTVDRLRPNLPEGPKARIHVILPSCTKRTSALRSLATPRGSAWSVAKNALPCSFSGAVD